MERLQDEIREIRKELRLAMNGVISTSMREKGIVYKLNFGVPYPEIKGIARKHKPNGELAAALWKEDIREFKILATFLQPAETLPLEEAKRWVKEIPYLEIAEHCCRNLFVHLPSMENFTSDLVADKENEFARTVAFLTWAEHFKQGGSLSAETLEVFWSGVLSCMMNPRNCKIALREKQASIQSMRFFGRQSKANAERILESFNVFKELMGNTPELQEIYNELKFEFEYYR
ncbi:DNA alkylation repair protein [Parabacteroides sp.]